ncbi:MAG: 2-hydroxyacyl-CoA dehydratase, partial [Chloroflexi bacterium]|nr:2-hydroxyacyl-CoA dehydratase [Chloroflexota bacterium]
MVSTQSIFQEEIDKYQKRLDRIDRNPSPTMLSANRLLYQAHLENNKAHLRWWQEGKPFIALAGAGLETLFRAFGEYQILPMVYIADRLGTKKAEEAMDKVRAMGLPDYACDRTMLFMPFATAGVELPKPKIIITRTGSCNVVNNSFRAMGRLLDVPVYTIEVPFSDPYQEHLDYVVEQLRDL